MAPELWLAVWEAYLAGDMAAAEAAQDACFPAKMLCRKYGQPAVQKVVLSHTLGVDCGQPRLPNLPLDGKKREEMLAEAAAMDLLATKPKL